MTRPAGMCVDRYELIAHIADGACAEVHLARDIATGTEVVVKFPHPSVLDHPVLRSRWRREVQLSRDLDHPNIARRLDLELRRSEPYVVVEYIGGGSLDAWFGGEAGALPVRQAVSWAEQIAQGLEYLHGRGIIHRDLKPENVMVTDSLEIKITDFSAATELSRHRGRWTLPAPPEGTAGYLSPEQALGEVGDGRTDIYQWGVLMYQMVTGQLPFPATDPLAAMEAHLRDDPAPPRELRPELSPQLEAVILKSLHRRADRRYAAASELLYDLRHLDDMDTADFDLSRDPPLHGTTGGAEARAIVRIALAVAAAFIGFTTLAIALTIALR